MAYDAARGRVVLFGGDSLRSALFNDTWEWDGENWTQMADIGPSARQGCSMAYDSARSRVVLFGGSAADAFFGDTWEWDGADWTQVADDGPAPRTNHATAFDAARNRVVLFGGERAALETFRDTWQWDGLEWTQQEDVGPSARRLLAMVYDGFRQRVVLFGGADADGVGLDDTWEWDGAIWTQVSNYGADPFLGAAMVFKGDKVALYGGLDNFLASAGPTVFGNTWEWDGKHWTKRQDIGPGPRWRHAMAYDSTRGRIVLFGGLRTFQAGGGLLSDSLLGDTWEHFEPPPPPLAIQSLDFSPPVIQISQLRPITGTITLTVPAPPDGTNVDVIADPRRPPFPTVVAIPGGLTTGQFTFDPSRFVIVAGGFATFRASIPSGDLTVTVPVIE
jgi:N-acetylneuraminic acid mutarotase